MSAFYFVYKRGAYMGLPNPKKRKPTASEVAAWARSRIGKRLDIDGRGGALVYRVPHKKIM